jgi:RNA polymerase sigma factor (sigma-70 family)
MRPITTNQLRLTVSQSDSLGPYLNEIRRCRPLGRVREQAALLAARAGDAAARELLVRHNQLFVLSLAKRYQTQEGTLTLGDLVQAGNVGLLEAVDEYDAEKNTKFITYAVWWIRKHMMEELGLAESLVSRPRHHYYQLAQVQHYVEAAQQRTGEEPSFEEVSEALSARVGRRPPASGIQAPQCPVLSLDAPRPDAEDSLGSDWHERIASSDLVDAERVSILQSCTQRVLSSLPALQSQVLVLRFGLRGGVEYSSEAAASELGLSAAVHKQTLLAALSACKRGLALALGCGVSEVLGELLND